MTFRNPVVNLLYMLFATDIPEWVTHEALNDKKFDITRSFNYNDVINLMLKSPGLMEINKECKDCKVLLILGDSDKRVNPRAGYYLYKKWEAMGLNVKCKVYKGEGHGIAKMENVFDVNLNVLAMILDIKLKNNDIVN